MRDFRGANSPRIGITGEPRQLALELGSLQVALGAVLTAPPPALPQQHRLPMTPAGPNAPVMHRGTNPQCGHRDHDHAASTATSKRPGASTATSNTRTPRRCSRTRITSELIEALLARRCHNHRFHGDLRDPQLHLPTKTRSANSDNKPMPTGSARVLFLRFLTPWQRPGARASPTRFAAACDRSRYSAGIYNTWGRRAAGPPYASVLGVAAARIGGVW